MKEEEEIVAEVSEETAAEVSKKNTALKIVKAGIKICLGAIAVLFAIFFIMSKVNSTPMFVFNKTAMWVLTESMDDTIPPKTYIYVEKATADDVDVGDIVVFRSTDPRIYGQYNTHRIISKTGNVFVTKGDNNPADDGEYSALAENIVGKYVRNMPVMTFIGRVVITPAGFASLMVLFVLTTVICFIPDMKAAIRLKAIEDEEEKENEKKRIMEEEIRRLKENGGAIEVTEVVTEETEYTEHTEEETD